MKNCQSILTWWLPKSGGKMQMEEKLMQTISAPETWILFEESMTSVLEKVGWPKADLPEALKIIKRKLNSVPAVQSGISD
ncbi:hypothetical protein C5S39_07390 [Candidatus Methanophagaceae archaeon]|nr:hypothetical protein C5S39_07390 [Methanophagales archaeon]